MNFIRYSFLVFVTGILTSNISNAQHSEILKSPDEKISVELQLEDGRIFYDVHYEEEQFLEESPLGLETSLGDFSTDLKYISSENSTVKKSYDLKNAKVSHVIYLANELVSRFVNPNEDTLVVTFRVSNQDVAYSYGIRSKEGKSNIKIFNEISGFDLPQNTTTYITPQAKPMTGWMETKPSYEEEYTLGEPIGKPSTYGEGYTFPALFKLQNKGWLLISETGVDSHYPGSRLSEGTEDGLYQIAFPQEGENNGIGDTFAAQALPAQTPWRTITLGRSLKPIVESTVAFDLVEQKYEPSIDYKMGRATWSWIVWQDNSINYEDQIKFIDLAEELDFEYVLIDNWWDNNIGRERIEELVDYAGAKGIGVILWYNSNGYWSEAPQTPKNRMNIAIARQQEMEWLQEIGVKGLKIDFFGGDKQTTIQLYEDILNDANNYGLAITFHGSTLPRGWEKMYPNFVTSEAVLASENLVFNQSSLDKHALNATILPFTRNTVGAMDFAPVFLNNRLSRTQEDGTIRSTTDAFELATAVLYFSPIQHFGVTPNNIEEQPEYVLDFLRNVPTVWDETIYIGGEPEDYVALARRKGDQWYVAVANGKKQKQTIELELPMLSGQEVKQIYDEKNGAAGIKTSKIKKNGKITVELKSEGGAILFN
ncbi:glycoside hydrolase family 97 catalytic domain-containing protein [Salegentibacter sp. F188]|uniref:Glycoside hydrolase family 97 catalytic domain-containing protein n=1 Tax=Autumnicola patrickiae TaxID=3075591 RepID=A0ABU3E416_9FLAO|nr:glycoside hydrolase family 97 catalytic domain-containing protein [Salegentibacter sp. F188]MDT0689997.1 glycoside hydrolase family 97 catalytic domain-containing protein [Salegentibacter sp. F188]